MIGGLILVGLTALVFWHSEQPMDYHTYNAPPFGWDECVFNPDGSKIEEPCLDLRGSYANIYMKGDRQFFGHPVVDKTLEGRETPIPGLTYKGYATTSDVMNACYAATGAHRCIGFYDYKTATVHYTYGDIDTLRHEEAHAFNLNLHEDIETFDLYGRSDNWGIVIPNRNKAARFVWMFDGESK